MGDYRNDRFQVGDIIRLKTDHQVFGRINKAARMSDIDDTGRWDEEYFWTDYYLDDGTIIHENDANNKYELIFKEVGFNQIKEYDRVLVANGRGLEGQGYWHCDIAAGWTNEPDFYEKKLMTISQPDVRDFSMFNIMPYNDYTKKFIGGNFSRPDFYYNSRSLPDILENMKTNPEGYKEIDYEIRRYIKYSNI